MNARKQMRLSRGVYRACSGIVEGVQTEPYRTYITRACAVIGAGYALDERAQAERQKLVEAVLLNVENRREYPFELLARRFLLPISHAGFKREREKFCSELARLCGFIEK